MEMGTRETNFGGSIRMTFTDLLKSVLKVLTELLNHPVREIMKDYEYFVGQIFTYTHQSIKYLYRHSQG